MLSVWQCIGSCRQPVIFVQCLKQVAQAFLGKFAANELQAVKRTFKMSISRVQSSLQAAMTSAQLRHQEAHAVWSRSVAAGQQMQADLVQLRSSTEQALRECR